MTTLKFVINKKLRFCAFCLCAISGLYCLQALGLKHEVRNTNKSVASKKSDKQKRRIKMVAPCLSYAILNGQEGTVQQLIDSGVDITIDNTGSGSKRSTLYDSLFIQDESARNKIVDILLGEIKKDRYKAVREDYLNRKNYSTETETPCTALERAFSLGYMNISEKLIEAGADCSDSNDYELNFFYATVKIKLLQKFAQNARHPSIRPLR